MKKHINMKNIIAFITGCLFSIILVCLMTFTSSYSKAAPSTITFSASTGVEYYISGQYVEYDETTRQYSVTKESPVTVAVINNNMICQAENNILLTVVGNNQTYTSATQMLTFNANVDEVYSITVNTRAISKSDHGKSLSDPYIIKSFNEYTVLYKVLAGKNLTESEETIHENIFDSETANNLSQSYFKLFDNIIVDMDEYYGLKNFQGVFDFNGYSITLSVTNKNYSMENDGIAFGGNEEKYIYAGLFSTLTNSTSAPCVIRNGHLRGSISLIPETPNDSGRVYVGGIAGKSIGTVFIDDIKTSVSLFAEDNASIYMGGFFGSAASPIDKHYGLTYNGVHTVLSATSNGENAYTYVGGYAGTVDNTYVTGYTDESNYLTIISNSLNSIAGGAVAGGFAAAIDHQAGSLDEISIDNIIFKTKGTLSISSVCNNDSANDDYNKEDGYAIAGGIFGVSYAIKPIKHGIVQFVGGKEENNGLLVDVYASNQSAKSHGNVFAGGLYGNVSGTNEFKYIPDEAVTVFDCDVSVRAIQNGHDEAKAGGLFGEGAFAKNSRDKLSIILTSAKGSINVKAEQSSISTYLNTTEPKEVSAGYYSSKLPTNYSLENVDFTVNNGTLVAQRSVGSTIFGAVYAGGFAGSAISSANPNTSTYHFKDIDINLNDSDVAALGLSFDSNAGQIYKKEDSNLAVGGFIGYIENYGTASINRNTNTAFDSDSGDTPGVENVSLNIKLSYSREYVVKGIQNAIGGETDHLTEGYVGGVIGFTVASHFRNISIIGDPTFDCLINSVSNNSPNTAACGGLIGENHKNQNFALENALVQNVNVRLDAYYFGEENEAKTYDTFCGGFIGVLADTTANDTMVRDVTVSNSTVSCIGENTMLAYAGGAFGGIWGPDKPKVYNCKVIDTDVYASSLGYEFYAGGISGLCAVDNENTSSWFIPSYKTLVIFEDCYVIDCTVSGYSVSSSGGIAGICPKLDGYSVGTKNCYSNAVLYGQTNKENGLSIFPTLPHIAGNNAIIPRPANSYDNNYFVPFNVQGVTENMPVGNIPYINDVNNNKHLAIANDTVIQSSVSLTNGQSVRVYPKTSNNNSEFAKFVIDYGGEVNLISIDPADRFTVTANSTMSGTVYANLYLEIYKVVDNEQILVGSYLFASYPIYINNGNSNTTYTVKDLDNDQIISPTSGTNYYIPVEVGSNEKQQIKIEFNQSTPAIDLYDLSDSNSNDIETLINNKGSAVVSNVFNGKVDIEITDKYILLTADKDILKRTLLGIGIGNSSYVFVDYTPNYVTSIEIRASSDTPALGTIINQNGDTYYVFAPGDTVVMEGIEHYQNGNEIESNVISYSYTTTTTSGNVTGYSNGRIDISTGVAPGTIITVTGQYVGALGYEGVDDRTYYIIVYSNINVTTNIVGGSYSANRKAVYGQDFTFTVNPNRGFGLSPKTVSFTLGNTVYDLTSSIENAIGSRPTSNKTVSVTVNNVTFNVVYNNNTGGYTITIPGSLMNSNLEINFEYALTADIIFDFGYAYASRGHDRYFIYEVKVGTLFDESIYNEIANSINVSLHGFDMHGYYLTDTATSIDSFGTSLEDIVKQGTKVVNGPLYFYARWTYEAFIEYPDGVTVESTLPIGLLEETVDGAIKLIPISTGTAFTFKIIPGANYESTPKFFAYIYDEDGNYNDITKYCKLNELGGYDIDPSVVNGIIFIKVMNENLNFNDGESEAEQSVDVTIYGDSVFTLNYTINYSSEGVSKANAVLGNDMTLQFDKALPSGTSIRLYRSYNSDAKDIYVYTLGSDSASIDLNSFIDMYDGKTLANSTVIDPYIFNETYYFIVTLPNNQQVNTFLDDNYARFVVNYIDSNNINITEYLAEEHKGQITSRPNYYDSGLGRIDFYVYQTLGVNVNKINNTLTVVFGEEVVVDGVVIEDLRHKDKYYVWEVYYPNGVNVSETDAVFGSTNFIINTLAASYYLANGTTNDITSLPAGTMIRLLEVTNTLSPASGIVLYSETIQ